MNSLKDAMNYINNELVKKFNWELKRNAEQTFIALVERRFL